MGARNKSTKEQKQRIALYGRVAVESPDMVAGQKAILEAELEKHQDWVLRGIYFDVGPSDDEMKQTPALRRMLQAAERGDFDRVVTTGISRISRGVPRLLEIVRFLKEKGVAVDFLKEGISTDTQEYEEMARWREQLGQ